MQRIKSKYNVGDRVFYYDVNTEKIIESKVVNVKRQNKLVYVFGESTGVKMTSRSATLEYNKEITDRILKEQPDAIFIGRHWVTKAAKLTYYSLNSVDGSNCYVSGWYNCDVHAMTVTCSSVAIDVSSDLIASTKEELLQRKAGGLYRNLRSAKAAPNDLSLKEIYKYEPTKTDLDTYGEEDCVELPELGSKLTFRFGDDTEKTMRLTEITYDENRIWLNFDLDKNGEIYTVKYTITIHGEGYQNVFSRLNHLENVEVNGVRQNGFGISTKDKLVEIKSSESKLSGMSLF